MQGKLGVQFAIYRNAAIMELFDNFVVQSITFSG